MGYEAQHLRGALHLRPIIESGVVSNWDDAEKLMEHIFEKELRIRPEDHSVMMSETPLTSLVNREKMMEMMFETFKVPGFHLVSQNRLGLYSTCRTTGIVVSIGHNNSYIMPFCEAHSINYAVQRLPIGGNDVTVFLQAMLRARGYNLSTLSDFDGVRDAKEKFCRCVEDYTAVAPTTVENYELPNGQVLELGSELYRAPEVLFQPSLANHTLQFDEGIHEVTHKAIMKTNAELHKDLFANVVLLGGGSLTPGLKDRLQSELAKRAPRFIKGQMKVNVTATPDDNATWVGGSILGSLPTFSNQWLTRAEFDESGTHHHP